jgi:hypothetical protein
MGSSTMGSDARRAIQQAHTFKKRHSSKNGSMAELGRSPDKKTAVLTLAFFPLKM